MRIIFPRGAAQPGDAELISAARTGDAEAYDELTARHADSARRLARLLVPTDAVDDLVAEAFAKVRLVLQRGDGPDLAFRPYLLTAVRRLHVDHRPAVQPAEAPTDEATDPAAARAFTSLAEPWRMVLWHTEVEEEGPDEIARHLGESPDSVPALVTRAREGMRVAWLTMHEPTTDKECEWTRHNLGAYVRKVSFDRDTLRVERHLEGCESCSAICLGLSESSSDLRGMLAPLVLGAAAATYVAAPAAATGRRIPLPNPARAGAAVAVLLTPFRRIGSASSGAIGRLGDRFGRVKDLASRRIVATVLAGVAAVAVIAGGAFVVVQAADGPPEANAEAPLADDLDDDPTHDTSDDAETDAPDPSGIGSATASEGAERPGDEPSDSPSATPSDDGFDDALDETSDDPSQAPTGPAGPGRPNEPPSQQPTQPGQQPSQPSQPPTQQPSQPPTQPPSQPPTPSTDMGVSASSSSLLGLVYSIEARVTGLPPGGSGTLFVTSTGGSETGLRLDGRCSQASNGGATCPVTQTPTTFRFRANALMGRPNTVTFTVVPDSGADADTSNNSTSVVLG